MGSLEIMHKGTRCQIPHGSRWVTIRPRAPLADASHPRTSLNTVKVWWIASLSAVVVIGTALVVAIALPGQIVLPDGPTSSPVPSMTTENWLNPAFSWRAAIIILSAVFTMGAIALVARAVERRRER